MRRIGITTTVPIEVLLAAGYQPIDLNNVFINSPNPGQLINDAERAGFPLNCCSWIKGIYGVCQSSDIDTVLCVTTGDCSNTIMLMEVLKLKGVKTIPFAFPAKPDTGQMQQELVNLAERLGTTLEAAEEVKTKLSNLRRQVHKLDRMTWQDGLVSGYENHLWLVSTSDFNQNTAQFQLQIKQLLKESSQRNSCPSDWLRLGYIGVPSVFGKDLYYYLEDNEVRVVFNEIQRQFAMPCPGSTLIEQYVNYTYPYSIYGRVNDIQGEIKRRRIDGIIHYVQAFCHRGIGDIIFHELLGLPILTLEGNQEFYLTTHNKTRIEAFLDMVRKKIKSQNSKMKSK
jgi:benzoyl-CoA reductase/2-hydroxyglutaryl-CoA dehydratase subunit BcrC/BadD/HgdB